MSIFRGFFGECVTSNIRLDFVGDPDREIDPRIFLKKFLPLRDNGNSTSFADNSKSCR